MGSPGDDSRLQPFAFAMNGTTWSIIKESFPELLPRLIVRGTIFARMSPDQKQQLVRHLQELGYYVGNKFIRPFFIKF